MNKCFGIASFLLAFFFIGCTDADEDCHSGKLNLVYDWSHSAPIQQIDNLMVIPQNGTASTMQTNNRGTTLNLSPGEYTFFAYEPVSTVNTDGESFTIKSDINGNIISPDAFSSGVLITRIHSFDKGERVLPMYYQTRELIVRINCIGDGLSNITSVNG